MSGGRVIPFPVPLALWPRVASMPDELVACVTVVELYPTGTRFIVCLYDGHTEHVLDSTHDDLARAMRRGNTVAGRLVQRRGRACPLQAILLGNADDLAGA